MKHVEVEIKADVEDGRELSEFIEQVHKAKELLRDQTDGRVAYSEDVMPEEEYKKMMSNSTLEVA